RKWKVPGVVDNPAAGITAGPDVQRNRFLSEEEAEALMHALHVDENQTAARSIMLLLLTGARRNEITHAKWTTSTGRTRRCWCRSLNPGAPASSRSTSRRSHC